MKVPKEKKAAVLNKDQKNKTLSGKIKKNRKVKLPARTVLVNKLSSKNASVIVKPEDVSKFQEKLLQFFEHEPQPKLKWAELKKYSKEERRKLKQNGRKVVPSRSYVLLGFNEVTRAMENRTASVIILDLDITPQILIKHFNVSCKEFKIPLIKVSKLKSVSLNCFGFASMAMALKKIPEHVDLHEFYKYLKQSCPNAFNTNQLKIHPVNATEETCVPEMPNDNQKPEISNGKQKSESSKTKNKELKRKEKETDAMEIDQDITNINDVYLYRDSKEKRCFVPVPKKNKSRNAFNADFIAFGDEEPTDAVVPVQEENILRSLKVKKLKANPNRKQK